jgi:hypothetical protein
MDPRDFGSLVRFSWPARTVGFSEKIVRKVLLRRTQFGKSTGLAPRKLIVVMKSPLLSSVLLTAAIGPVLTSPAFAAFSLFENFNGLNVAPLSGQGGWTGNVNASVVDTGAGDKVAQLATGGTGTLSNWRPLGGLSIPDASTASAVYWNFTISSVAASGNNWNFIITDVTNPPDTAGSSEVQFNYDSSQPAVRARNGANFMNLSLNGTVATDFNPLINVQYNAWFQINNSSNSYTVYLQSNGDARVAVPTQMLADNGSGGTFGFRNGAAANDLITSNFGSASTASVVQIDDIYVDLAGTNLTNPSTVPEPASGLMALAAGSLLLSARRRRQ